MAAKSCKCDCGNSSKKLADLEKRLAKLEKNDSDLQGRFKRMRTLTQQMGTLYGQMWAALLRGNLPQFWNRFQAWGKVQMQWMGELLGISSGGGGGGSGANAMDLARLEKKIDQVYKKANDAAYAAQKASQGIAETRRLANDAAAGIRSVSKGIRSVSNKVTGAERKILATLAAMSIAIAGVAGAAAAAVIKAFALTFAGLSGLVQAAIAQLKILTAGFTAMQTSLNAIQNLLNNLGNAVNRVEKAVHSVLNMLNRTQLEVDFISKMVENIYGYIQYLDKKFTGYHVDLRADNTRAQNLINGTRTLLAAKVDGVITLLRARVSGSFSLPTPTGGSISFPFVGDGFDGVKSGLEQVGSAMGRILRRQYEQKIIDVFKFNAQIAQKNQDGGWENITKEITSIKVGNDATHIFDSQVLTDLQELKKREPDEPVLALADQYGIRPGNDRPVLVIAYRQRIGEKWGRSTFALSLFHPSATALEYLFSPNAVIQGRQVGKSFASLVLKDGSRIKVMSPNVATSRSYLEYLLQWVDSAVIPANYSQKIIDGEGYDHGSRIEVRARKIEYYPNGQRANISPERQKYFD